MHAFSWPSDAEYVVLIVATLSAIGASIRFAFKAMRFFDRLETTMRFCETELRPNGGNSLRDAIDQMGDRIARLEHLMTPRNETR
jgi:hypothetical protein